MNEGIKLCARYAFPPNRLSYCGPENSYYDFSNLIKNEKNEELVKSELLKFEALRPYLEAISEKNGLDVFDEKTVSAYWLGNDLLSSFTEKDMAEVLDSLVERGLVKSLSEKLKEKLIPGFSPHHSFHVFFVGVGVLTGSVPSNLENKNKCLILPARVESTGAGGIEVMRDSVVLEKGNFFYKKEAVRETVKDEFGFLSEVSPGDFISIHWDLPVEKLSKEKVDSLRFFTGKTLSTLSRL